MYIFIYTFINTYIHTHILYVIYIHSQSGYIIKRVIHYCEVSDGGEPKLAAFLLHFPSEFTYFSANKQYLIKDRVTEQSQ